MLVTSVYKPPNTTLTTRDWDILTQRADWLISAGNYNAKRSMRFSWTTNPVGTTLYNYAAGNDYFTIASDSLTH